MRFMRRERAPEQQSWAVAALLGSIQTLTVRVRQVWTGKSTKTKKDTCA